MDATTISISDSTKRDLFKIKAKLEEKSNRFFSFDKVIKEIIKGYYEKGGPGES